MFKLTPGGAAYQSVIRSPMKIDLLKSTENIDSLVELINSAYRGKDGERRWTSESHLVSGDRIDLIDLQKVIESENCDLFVASIGDKLVGCICSTEYPDYIEYGLYAISPEFHGMGFGKKLLAHVERVKETKNKKYRVSVVSKNTALIEFYTKRGYTKLSDRLPYPVHLNVGDPLVDNLDLTVLQKRITIWSS